MTGPAGWHPSFWLWTLHPSLPPEEWSTRGGMLWLRCLSPLRWSSRALCLGKQPPAACWDGCAQLCVPFWGPHNTRDTFLSSQPSHFTPPPFFFSFDVFYHHLPVLLLIGKKKKSNGVTKLHVICRRLFPQAQIYCGREDDNLLKKNPEGKEKRHRACHFMLQNHHQTANMHWEQGLPGHATRIIAPRRSSPGSPGEPACPRGDPGHLKGWWKFTDKCNLKVGDKHLKLSVISLFEIYLFLCFPWQEKYSLGIVP